LKGVGETFSEVPIAVGVFREEFSQDRETIPPVMLQTVTSIPKRPIRRRAAISLTSGDASRNENASPSHDVPDARRQAHLIRSSRLIGYSSLYSPDA